MNIDKDQLALLTVEYLEACSKMEKAKIELMAHLYDLVFSVDESVVEVEAEVEVEEGDDIDIERDQDRKKHKKINYFKQWLVLKSDGDVVFELEIDSSNPFLRIGYTAGPNGDPLDHEIQEAIMGFCSVMGLDFNVDFDDDEPEIVDGRATYYFE